MALGKSRFRYNGDFIEYIHFFESDEGKVRSYWSALDKNIMLRPLTMEQALAKGYNVKEVIETYSTKQLMLNMGGQQKIEPHVDNMEKKMIKKVDKNSHAIISLVKDVWTHDVPLHFKEYYRAGESTTQSVVNTFTSEETGLPIEIVKTIIVKL